MILSVVDDWLDIDFCANLANHIIYYTDHSYGQNSESGIFNSDGMPFYYVECNTNNFHVKYMCGKVVNSSIGKDIEFLHGAKSFDFSRVYANIQYPGMDGAMHTDDGDMTALYMITNTLGSGIGAFEYIEEGKCESIDFVQNRLVLFEGNMHRGLAPKEGEPRVTVAFKIVLNRENDKNL